MVININDIPEEGLKVNINDFIYDDNIDLEEPVKASIYLNRISNEVLVKGNIEFVMIQSCNRCLNRFSKNINMDISLSYNLSSKDLHVKDKQLIKNELDEEIYFSDEIDLFQIIKEQAFLNIPMKSLCSEDCKGLCPSCGKNLNDGLCDCNR